MAGKDEYEWVIKDNVFHRRVSDVRNKVQWDFEQTGKAMELLAQGAGYAGGQEAHQVALTEEEIEAMAFFDPQTPVLKFQYMLRMLRRELKRAHRYQRPISILIVAIDSFEGISKRYGALAQEQVLQSVGNTLNRLVRSDVDLVGRYVNERFILILPETPGKGATVLAERIRKTIETNIIEYQWHQIASTVSIGISHRPGHAGEAEELIVQADMACESVERRGGNGTALAPMTAISAD
ncbi:MAG TPA: GGDEF domain-containing protein [Candidatus Obscuribacterales bacterium]